MSIKCDCEEKGLAIKIKGISTRLCQHTSLLGTCPKILTYWSSNNTLTPDNVLSKSGKKYLLICGNSNCKFENAITAYNIVRSFSFKCKQCKSRFKLADFNKVCNCIELGIAKKTQGGGFLCEHNNLLISKPEVLNFWSIKNNKHPSELSKCSTSEIILVCNKCNYEDKTTALNICSLRNKYECPKCFMKINNLTNHCSNIHEYWSSKNKANPDNVNYGSNEPVILFCKNCNLEDEKTPKHLSTVGKYICNKCKTTTLLYPQLIEEVNDGTDLSKLTYGS